MGAKNPVQVIGDMLYDHEWERLSCKCGWTTTEPGSGTDDHVDHQARFVLEALTAAGLAVVACTGNQPQEGSDAG